MANIKSLAITFESSTLAFRILIVAPFKLSFIRCKNNERFTKNWPFELIYPILIDVKGDDYERCIGLIL